MEKSKFNIHFSLSELENRELNNNNQESKEKRRKLYFEKHFSDFTFIVEKTRFPVHKFVLSEKSSYFYNMFTSLVFMIFQLINF